MRIILALIFCSLCPVIAQAQVLEGKVISLKDDSPVAEAFIFISNSNYGVVSDDKGFFQIDITGITATSLTISQINYELKIIDINPDQDGILKIYLEDKQNEVHEVELSEKYNSKIRKRRVNRFVEAIMGAEYDKKKIQLVNADKILLYEEGKVLKVQPEEPLIIDNVELGYRLRFFLSDFALHKNDNLMYVGSAFFEELPMSRKEKARALKNRRKAYRLSKRDFVSRLFYEDELSEYDVYHQNTDHQTGKEQYIQNDTLISRLELGMNTQKRIILVVDEIKVHDLKYNSYSYLKPRKRRLIIDQYGNILNSKEVEESGYWAQNRLAMLLPFDYSPGKP